VPGLYRGLGATLMQVSEKGSVTWIERRNDTQPAEVIQAVGRAER
jgi:hypothetical protein